MKLGIDISYYNLLTPNQKAIVKDICDFVIVRLSYGLTQDSKAEEQVNWVRAMGLKLGGYHWTDPTRSYISQAAFAKTMVDKFKPDCWYGDFEQYWRDWAAYMRQDLAEAYRTRFTPLQLETWHKQFWTAIEGSIRDIPVGIYSADWYMLKYAPALKPWVITKNYWEARYTRYYDPEVDKLFIGQGEIEPAIFRDLAFTKLSIPNGIIRQFSSYALVKGFALMQGYHLDWNMATDAGYERMFNSEIIIVPPNDPPPVAFPAGLFKVTAAAVWIRSEPSMTGSKVGYRWKNETIAVLGIVKDVTGYEWGKTMFGYIGMSNLAAVEDG